MPSMKACSASLATKRPIRSRNPKDEKQRETIKAEFAKRDDNFHKIMDEAKDYSKKANDLAKESAKRGN